jgi:ABC-2 type transport system ATP-binding protein
MIHLDNVTKQYDLPSQKGGSLIAANRLNLVVPAGAVFGLVGPNGAGKTTTLKMICGLQTPTAGKVTVNDIDMGARPKEAQRNIGYLADSFGLYLDLKVWEYLEYFARAHKIDPKSIDGRIDEMLRLMNLEAKRDAFVGGLSHGMKQRLGIARAIIHDPPLLVLDEPAGGLDPKARAELKELLKQFHTSGKTILITSHILSDMEEICTSIAIIEKGRLLRVGSLEAVMREGTGAPRFRIKLACPGFGLAEFLRTNPGISDLSIDAGDAGAAFAFAGSHTELANIVKGLVLSGAPVYRVEELSETLESLYSRISSGDPL